MFNNIDLNVIKFPSFNRIDDYDIKISNEIHIIFAITLSKDEFLSLFLDICDEQSCDNKLINDIIKKCIRLNSYNSINCIIWLLYTGYIKSNSQFKLINNFIKLFDQFNSKNDYNKILILIEDCKNNKIDYLYYKNLLKNVAERDI